MGFFDSLFGGGSTEQSQSWDAGTRARANAAMDFYRQGMHPYSGYAGPGQAARNQMANSLGMNFSLYNDMAMHPQRFADVQDDYLNPYLGAQQSAYQSAADHAQKMGLSQMSAGLLGRGQGSRGELALGNSLANMARNSAQDMANMSANAYSEARGWFNQDQAARRESLLNAMGLGYGAMGDLERQFTEQRDWDKNQATWYGQGISPLLQYGGTQTQTTKQNSNPFSQLLGFGTSLASMFFNPAGTAMGLGSQAAQALKSGMGGWGKTPSAPGTRKPWFADTSEMDWGI